MIAMTYMSYIYTVVKKDLLYEIRSKEIISSILVFSLISIVTFNFAFDPTPKVIVLIVPGILWVSLTFGAILGFNRAFALENENGGFDGTLMTPIPKDALFIAKSFSSFIFLVIVEVFLIPLLVVFFHIEINLLILIPVSLLALLGLSFLGCVFGALSVNTRASEVMLPVLFIPVIIPLVLGATQGTQIMLAGGELKDALDWIGLMAVFDVTYMIVGAFCFSIIVSE